MNTSLCDCGDWESVSLCHIKTNPNERISFFVKLSPAKTYESGIIYVYEQTGDGVSVLLIKKACLGVLVMSKKG